MVITSMARLFPVYWVGKRGARRGTLPAMGLDQPLWRGVIVFRLAALGYAVVLLASKTGEYEHPVTGWVVIAVMAVWTVVSGIGYRLPSRRGWPLLIADLLVGVGCLLASRWVISADDL